MTSQRVATAPTDSADVVTHSRWGIILGAGLALIVVAFIPPWAEPFTMPKVLIAAALAGVMAALVVTRRTTLTLNRVPLLLAAAFVLLALASQLLSGAPQAISFWGEWSRRSGFLTVVILALLLTAAAVLTRNEARVALRWLIWAGVPASIYGAIQVAGADPFTWNNEGWVVSTFGNPNFAAAGLAMLAVLTAGFALVTHDPLPARIAMFVLAAVEAFLSLQTGSAQGLFAIAAGVGVGALVFILRPGGARRQLIAGALALVGVLGAALTALGISGAGPLTAFVSPDTLMFRQWYWGAAINMIEARPILGVGPDGFGRFYGEFRSVESAEMLTLGTSAAHSVPLQWAATLGAPAGIAYIGLMVAVAVIVAMRLIKTGPTTSPLLVPVAAAWAAYQTQSLVSIDSTAIGVLGWVLTGLLLALSLPGPPSTTSTMKPATTTLNQPQGRLLSIAGVAGLVALLLWLPALLPSNASRAVVQGTTEDAVLQGIGLVESTRLPCEPSVSVGRWTISVAPSELTVGGVFAGADAKNRCYGLVNAAADFAIQLEQLDQSLAYSKQGVTIDPLNFAPWLLLARAEHANGNDEAASQALAQALTLAPGAQVRIGEVATELGLPEPAQIG